jgi:hypothetical protein
MHPLLRLVPLLAILGLLSGCAHYVPPGPKADLALFSPTADDIAANFDLKPANPFPAAIAFVRAQGPRYTNLYLSTAGGVAGNRAGRYTIVTVREVGEEAQLERIAALPQVAGITGINRLLLPETLDTERDLRSAAARLQADLLLLYTFDTVFIDRDAAKPLSVVTLGLSPTRRITAITTVSALLIDTRTGFIHGTFEATEKNATLATSWGSADSADATRRATEKAAFAKLIDEFAAAWPKIVARPRSIPSSNSPAP